MKKKFTEETVSCPYCNQTFNYNVASLKAKVECPHCKTDLIVRNRHQLLSGLIAIPLFFVIKSFLELTGISQLGAIIELPCLIVIALLVFFVLTKICVKVKGVDKVFIVDCEDPTVLERKRKRK